MRDFTAYSPGGSFPSVSVTGSECALGCSHCSGSYLRGMLPAKTPDELVAVMTRVRRDGASGILLSGGFDAHGTLPLEGLLGALAEGRRKTGLLVNVHPGMQDPETFEDLFRAGADCVSLDVLDEPKARRRYPLPYELADYIGNALSASRAGLRTVPHLTVGMNASDARVIDALPGRTFPRIIVNTLLGHQPGVDAERLKAETVSAVGNLALSAKVPEVVVGCMRPRGDPEFEKRLVLAGACGMVNPDRRTLDQMERDGFRVSRKETCCAL